MLVHPQSTAISTSREVRQSTANLYPVSTELEAPSYCTFHNLMNTMIEQSGICSLPPLPPRSFHMAIIYFEPFLCSFDMFQASRSSVAGTRVMRLLHIAIPGSASCQLRPFWPSAMSTKSRQTGRVTIFSFTVVVRNPQTAHDKGWRYSRYSTRCSTHLATRSANG